MSEATMVETQPSAPVTDDVLYEVVDGRIVEKPPMGIFQCLVAAWLVRLMNTSAEVSRLGRVVPEALFLLDPARKLKRRPDVAFVSYERWLRKRPIPEGEAWEVVPDLAVEVASPANSFSEMVGKVDEYFLAGVQLVWLLIPVFNKVYAYTWPTQVRILQPGDELDGGAVLPGFRVPVKSLFEDED